MRAGRARWDQHRVSVSIGGEPSIRAWQSICKASSEVVGECCRSGARAMGPHLSAHQISISNVGQDPGTLQRWCPRTGHGLAGSWVLTSQGCYRAQLVWRLPAIPNPRALLQTPPHHSPEQGSSPHIPATNPLLRSRQGHGGDLNVGTQQPC